MQQSFLFLADGFEEIEALATTDVLRRGGMEVKTVSITDRREVTGANGITVVADMLFKECDFSGSDFLIVPGGMPGAANLHEFGPLNDLLRVHKGKIAAICAAPAVVLAPLGLLKGKEATCYPGFEAQCVVNGAIMKDQRVVALDRLITANGPASAIRFALAILKNAMGPEVARQVGSGMLVYGKQEEYYF